MTSTTGTISMMVPLVLVRPWKNPLSLSVVIARLTELSSDEEATSDFRIVEHPGDQFHWYHQYDGTSGTGASLEKPTFSFSCD